MLALRSEISVAEMGDRIYVMGGYPGTRITVDDVQVYDSRTDSWAAEPPLPVPLTTRWPRWSTGSSI